MSRWDEQFENHEVFSTMAAVRERLEAFGKELDDADVTSRTPA